jgi:hypothetical protein
MKWRRNVDYHGSRPYEADSADMRPFSGIRGWFAKLARRNSPKQFNRPTGRLSKGAQEGFSWLGGTSPAAAQRPSDCPFPVKPGSFEGRDWRLLP